MQFGLADETGNAEILALVLLIHLGKGKGLVDALDAAEVSTELALNCLLLRPVSFGLAADVTVFCSHERWLNLLTLGLQTCGIYIALSEQRILSVERESRVFGPNSDHGLPAVKGVRLVYCNLTFLCLVESVPECVLILHHVNDALIDI